MPFRVLHRSKLGFRICPEAGAGWARLQAFGLIAGAVLLGAAGCSGAGAAAGSEAFGADPYETLSTNSGALLVELRTAPDQPPTRGASGVELRVLDAQSLAPVDDLQIAIVPWMPAMGHGSPPPAVSARGDGRYVAQSVSLFMPGVWELRTTFAGAVADTATPTVDVR